MILLHSATFYPENSLAALKAHSLELDLHVSVDGAWMVIRGSKIATYAEIEKHMPFASFCEMQGARCVTQFLKTSLEMFFEVKNKPLLNCNHYHTQQNMCHAM